MTIFKIVQRSDTTPGRIFDAAVIVLIFVSIIVNGPTRSSAPRSDEESLLSVS